MRCGVNSSKQQKQMTTTFLRDDGAKANDIERATLLVISKLPVAAAFTSGSTVMRQPAEASLVVCTHAK